VHETVSVSAPARSVILRRSFKLVGSKWHSDLGRCYDVCMTRNHVPRGILLPPDIREPPLHSPSCPRCVPAGSTVSAPITMAMSALNRSTQFGRSNARVADQTALDQRQDIASARRYLILEDIHDKFFRPTSARALLSPVENRLTLLFFELADSRLPHC